MTGADHPGTVLASTLTGLGMSQAELARRTGLTPKHLNRIINGHQLYSPEVAVRLGEATLVHPAVWWGLASWWMLQEAVQGHVLAHGEDPTHMHDAHPDHDDG